MKKVLHNLIITIFLLCCGPSVFPEILTLGNGDDWSGTSFSNLETTAGRGGFMDLVIKTTELSPMETTDLLLPFNRPEQSDRSGHYKIMENPDYNQEFLKTGSGSGTFFKGMKMTLLPEAGALFSAHTNWEDFTIEFWLYPANTKEGEQILQWKGLGRAESQIYSQTVQAHFLNRKLVWSFDNFFQLPGSPFSHYEISGEPLLPREWHHHMLRYNSRTGMLEYLIDGIPSAIIYTTDSGNESRTVYMPRIGEEPGELKIGETLTGFVDEFRIEKAFVENRSLNRYSEPGFGVSQILDLTYPDSRIRALDIVRDAPGNAEVFPYYYMGNDRLEAERIYSRFRGEATVLEEGSPWRPFSELPEGGEGSRGRFLMVAFLLYPDLKTDRTPRVSSVRIDYAPALPPLPPTRVRVERIASGEVALSWNASPSPDVEGYLIFYGEKPGEYIYPNSPVDAGKGLRREMTGLSPFKQYFFAVKSYNAGEIPQYSDFSEEISIRP